MSSTLFSYVYVYVGGLVYVCTYVRMHCLCILLSIGTVQLNAYVVCKKNVYFLLP